MMQKINKRCSNKNTFIHKLPDKIPEIVRNISVCYNLFTKNITICSRTSINIFALTMAFNLNIQDHLKWFLLELLVMCTYQYYFWNRLITDCNKVRTIVMMLWEFIISLKVHILIVPLYYCVHFYLNMEFWWMHLIASYIFMK